ncbi:2'-5' RNA ligase family protein [Mycolicibacterium confluentis]|uniref:Uncharacterized protein n=1 Tax=Mycolicibacterium confluentis TaxID=28047 RepID=A0A7I7XXJ6_9MYCO|nr:2'-5' RNA ligase family protein [Mycolicibacterium confluentis]MCV7322030.1 2'-5' RNA ligase family protein [Mycolicibacterium confluentis]ORV32263.1 hypothetical protein AWB99_11550 [Mycolicibacterium confluentis]BBZ33854.1 hypothetical protein MCNF_24590 [Mycolicibacterium confluentis]
MAHSIELLFDDRTEAALRGCWQQLTDAGLPSQARIRAETNRPHVTLVAAEHIDASVDDVLAGFARRLPLPCTVGALLLFGRAPYVLARLIVPTVDLLDLHRDVAAACGPHLPRGAMAHSDPDAWTPHTTLARRLRPEQLSDALTLPGLSADRHGHFAGLRRWDGDARVDLIYG